MNSGLLNLLPRERLHAWKRDYFIRLATVCTYALIAVVIGSGALLVPSYLYLHQQMQVEQARSNELDMALSESKGKQTTQRLTALSATATYLARLAHTPTASAALRGVLAVPRLGITITGATFQPATASATGKMALMGIATTREALQTYTQALGALPYVSNVDLPIGTYAKDADIPFTITLTGTLKP